MLVRGFPKVKTGVLVFNEKVHYHFIVFTIRKRLGVLRDAQVGFLRGLSFHLRYKTHREQQRSVVSVVAPKRAFKEVNRLRRFFSNEQTSGLTSRSS